MNKTLLTFLAVMWMSVSAAADDKPLPPIEHLDRRLPYPPSTYKEGIDYFVDCLSQARAGTLSPAFVPKGHEDDGACVPQPYKSRPIEIQKEIMALWEHPAMYEAILSELRTCNGSTSDETAAARRKLGSIPLIVLSSDKAHFTADRPKGVSADALYAAWIAGHVDLTHDSTRGEHRIVDGASHFIFNERPDAVLSAFQEVVKAARVSGTTAASK